MLSFSHLLPYLKKSTSLKNILVLGVILISLNLSYCKAKEPLSLAGSETMHEMILLLTNEFQKQNVNYLTDVRGGGSKLGIDALMGGIIDIAMVSRVLNPQEKETLNQNNNLEEIVIAYDGAAIIVHPDNPINSIDLQTLSDIFTGKIKNWKEIGGDDIPIETVIRNNNSGTGLFFKEHVVQKKDLGENFFDPNATYTSSAIVVDDNIELANKVAGLRGSISYIGMGSAANSGSKIKIIMYSRKKDDEPVAPTITNLINRKYRLARGLYLVYKNENKKAVDEFVTFATGEVGQKIILKSGYLRSTLEEVEVKANR
jgi:phosphate transport system substrate-binding protein